MKTASKLSSNDALVALVCWRPQASAIGADDCAENRHGQQSGDVSATDRRFFAVSARQPERGQRCPEVEQRCGGHGPRIVTKALNEGRGDTEHEGGEYGQR